MGFRVVNGSTHTEDGWRCCNRDECGLVRIPNLFLTDTAPLRNGSPLIILGAWLYWYDRNVEEITSPVWGWSLTNDVLGKYGMNNGSNHLSATAVDVNAPRYPWGTYRMAQHLIDKVEEGRRLFSINGESAITWGRKWSKPDEMHYQMAWREGDPRNDQLAAKLLGGYLGIYAPGPTPTPAPTGKDAVVLLIIGESKRRNHAPHETIAEIATGIQESNLDPNAVDATGHRGVYQQDGGYSERGTVTGQIKGFFDRLDAKRASSGASQDIWLNIFWLQQRPSDPSADVAYAKGRKGYLTEIKSRTAAATDYYNRLAGAAPAPVPVPTGDEDMAQVPQAEWNEVRDKTRALHFLLIEDEQDSTSRYGDAGIKWPIWRLLRNIDGFAFNLETEHNAALGGQWAINQITKKAAAGDVLAQEFLDRMNSEAPAPAPEIRMSAPYLPQPQPMPMPEPLPAPEPLPTPEPLPVPYEPDTKSLAEVVKTVVEAVEQLNLGDALSNKEYATLDASIKILQMKNGN